MREEHPEGDARVDASRAAKQNSNSLTVLSEDVRDKCAIVRCGRGVAQHDHSSMGRPRSADPDVLFLHL